MSLRTRSKPTIKQKLAAIRMLYDFLVIRQLVPVNPTASVRGPKYVVKRGKTPVWSREDAKKLLESISRDDLAGLRDRALISWTAEQADHSVQMLRKHYWEVVDWETAERYWAIRP